MIDIDEQIKVQKVKWIKWYFQREELHWKETMQEIISVKKLDIFLKSNFEIPIKLKLHVFYYKLLKVWSEIKYRDIASKENVLNRTCGIIVK